MPKYANTKCVTERTVKILGGPEKAREIINAEFMEMQQKWSQDVVTMGRILRSHLYVEHYLSEYIEKANPRLGSVANARLSFAQKLYLLDSKNSIFTEILPGIKHLNVIRNRLAHRLSAVITAEDTTVFLAAKLFKALREAGAKPNLPSNVPLDIMEEFAQYASASLSSEFSAFSSAFGKALSEFTPPTTT